MRDNVDKYLTVLLIPADIRSDTKPRLGQGEETTFNMSAGFSTGCGRACVYSPGFRHTSEHVRRKKKKKKEKDQIKHDPRTYGAPSGRPRHAPSSR